MINKTSYTIILLLLFYFANCKRANENKNPSAVSSSFYSINLGTIADDSFSFSKVKDSKAAVLLFLSPECPICQSYSLTINELMTTYKDKGIAFYGVFPGIYFSPTQIKAYLNEYNLYFISLLDPQLILAKNLNAKTTPEAFVIDSLGRILYQGSIDNWFYSVGKHRAVITKNYLKDVLEAVVTNKTISVQNTEAVGCFIE